jgi:riboflavin biosynthesis pyrimidine reductase
MRVLVDRVSGRDGSGSRGADDPAERDLSDEDLAGLYAAPDPAWLRVNMVSTVDGAATGADGLTASVNNPADHRVFTLLRRLADCVVVGAGTARAEGYRPTSRPTVLVSRRGEVPPSLRHGAPGSVLLATCAVAPGLAESRQVLGSRHVLVLGEDAVDLASLRDQLAERGLRQVLSEGGPHLLRDLVASGAVDELCATVVPRLVAGDGPRISAGPPVDARLRLRLLVEEHGTLLGRWYLA